MSEAWIAVWNHGADVWAAAMVRAGGQGSMVLTLAWAAGRVFPRLSPTARCWLWRLAFVKLLVLAGGFRPIDLPLWHRAVTEHLLRGTPFLKPVLFPVKEPVLIAEGAGMTVLSSAAVLVLLWLLGVAVYLARFAGQCRQTARRRALSEPLRDERLLAECAALAVRLGLRQVPELLAAPGSGSPWLVGIRRPAIVFPAALLSACGEDEPRLMLAHELAHLRQRDLAWGWLGMLAQGLFFFHPLVWLAGGEWRLAQEMACDAIAIAVTRAPAAEYGGVLLKVAAQRAPGFHGGPVAVGVIESYHTLERRLVAMKTFGSLSPRRLGRAGMALAALAVLVLIPWRVVAQEPRGQRVTIVLDGPARGDIMDLARRPDVQAHLQLNPQQRNAFAEVQSRIDAFGNEERVLANQEFSEQELKARMGERHARVESAHAEMMQQLQTVLAPAQLQRLRELFVQWQGPLGLANPETAAAVGLSPAHRDAIGRIIASMKERAERPVRVEVRAEGEPGKLEAEEKQLHERTLVQHVIDEKARLNEASGQILSVLDAGERARWNALQGAPFAFAREGELHTGDVRYRVLMPPSPDRP
jgi:beta-lactamase regulating signal transducer with metallopeptidase domain